MKKTILIIATVLSAVILFAQAPQAFKYQTVVRDNSGNLMINQNVSFQISIVKGSTNGTPVFVEMHALTSNAFGLANLEIGNGTLVSGNFATINWGDDSYFIQVEMDNEGGSNYQLMGVSQLLSIPYSLYSEYTGDTTRWRKVNNDLYFSNGNVGIGTITPTEKLHIIGNIKVTGITESDIADNFLVWLADSTFAIRNITSLGSVASEPNTIVKRDSNNYMFAERIYFEVDNSTSIGDTVPRIRRNQTSGRQELIINAGRSGYSNTYDGASIHVHGNDDNQHKGALALLTGGHGRMLINEFGQIAIGGEFEAADSDSDQLYNYMDNGNPKGDTAGMDGFLNIINDFSGESGIPSLYLAHSNKDISWTMGENLQFGTWDRLPGTPVITGDWEPKLTITSEGNALLTGLLFENADINLKKNITPLEEVLPKIKLIQPIKYVNKDNEYIPEGSLIGFSAQEIKDIFPELVSIDHENETLAVSYSHMSAVAIQAINEQQIQIEQLQKELKDLKTIIHELIKSFESVE